MTTQQQKAQDDLAIQLTMETTEPSPQGRPGSVAFPELINLPLTRVRE